MNDINTNPTEAELIEWIEGTRLMERMYRAVLAMQRAREFAMAAQEFAVAAELREAVAGLMKEMD